MSRGTKIARALGKGHDKLRQIFMESTCLKLLSGDQQNYNLLTTIDSRWYLDKREYTQQVSGKVFKRLVVDDLDGCRVQHLRAMTAIAVETKVFKFLSKDDFTGSVPSYEFKVYATGDYYDG